MHLSMIVMAVALAAVVRLGWLGYSGALLHGETISCSKLSSESVSGGWVERWQLTLGLFLFPPLLLLATALAILWMGPQGNMMGWHVGWGSYGLAVGFLAVAGLWGIGLTVQGWRSLKQVRSYPSHFLGDRAGYILNTSILFAAQVGFWQPELVVSQGLMTTLTPEQIEAVLTHEQAHGYYRDTFWFFWLGWVRQLTRWLPHTESLWQELLLLRELRADHWAAQRVDALLLADVLLLMVQSPLTAWDQDCPSFAAIALPQRLEERVNALITEAMTPPETNSFKTGWWSWSWLLLTVLPLLTVVLHQ